MTEDLKRLEAKLKEFPPFEVASNPQFDAQNTYDEWVRLYNRAPSKLFALGEIAKAYAGMMELYRDAIRQWDAIWKPLNEWRRTEGLSSVQTKMIDAVLRSEPPSDTEGYMLVTGHQGSQVEILNRIRDGMTQAERDDAAILARHIRGYMSAALSVQFFACEAFLLAQVSSRIVRQGSESRPMWSELPPEDQAAMTPKLGRRFDKSVPQDDVKKALSNLLAENRDRYVKPEGTIRPYVTAMELQERNRNWLLDTRAIQDRVKLAYDDLNSRSAVIITAEQ